MALYIPRDLLELEDHKATQASPDQRWVGIM